MEATNIYIILLQVYHFSKRSDINVVQDPRLSWIYVKSFAALSQDEEIQVNLVCVDIVYFIFEIQKFWGGGM